ncbi:hypothetical protein GLOIN_2v848825 [Rhizophagus clarus]|nr:hypothetical protein GLOIN_2v848825 [Rhizophagus clarus]
MDNENHVSYDKGEKFATHVAISPNGQYICTLNSRRLQFKIFESDQTISYFDNSSVTEEDTNKFVEIPKINSSENDDLVLYQIEHGALHEYKDIEVFDKKYGSGRVFEESHFKISKSENHLDEKPSMEYMKKEDQESNIPGFTSRTFPTWSLAISNMMEHQGEYVIFIAISAIIEANMKKKIDEEEEINRLYPNRDRYNNDEYEIENNDGDDDGDDDDDDNLDVDRHKSSQPDLSEGKTVIYRIVLRYNNLIQKPDIIPQYNCYNVAGIVMFVKEEHNNPYAQHDEQSEHNYLTEMLTTNCTIINAEGIYRINYSISNSFYNKSKEEKFTFPKKVRKRIKILDNVHTIDMYNLSTMEQEQIFIIRHNEKVFHTAKNVSSIFPVSQNKQLIACSNGERSVTLFWIGNGLDIGVKEFGIETKILFLEFIENDERLLIITEETCTKEELKIINGDEPDMFENNLDYKQKKVQYDVNYGKLSTVMEEERKNPDDKKTDKLK